MTEKLLRATLMIEKLLRAIRIFTKIKLQLIANLLKKIGAASASVSGICPQK